MKEKIFRQAIRYWREENPPARLDNELLEEDYRLWLEGKAPHYLSLMDCRNLRDITE